MKRSDYKGKLTDKAWANKLGKLLKIGHKIKTGNNEYVVCGKPTGLDSNGAFYCVAARCVKTREWINVPMSMIDEVNVEELPCCRQKVTYPLPSGSIVKFKDQLATVIEDIGTNNIVVRTHNDNKTEVWQWFFGDESCTVEYCPEDDIPKHIDEDNIVKDLNTKFVKYKVVDSGCEHPYYEEGKNVVKVYKRWLFWPFWILIFRTHSKLLARAFVRHGVVVSDFTGK